MAEIKRPCMDEDYRGYGHVRSLLEAAITEAIVRHCESVWCCPTKPYGKRGFLRVTELADWPLRSTSALSKSTARVG